MIQLETRKLTFLLCIVIVLLLGLFVFGAFGRRTSRAIIRPFVKMWQQVVDSKAAVEDWVDVELAEKDKKIQELEKQVQTLELQVEDVRRLSAENEQLRRLFALESKPRWEGRPAEVILRDPILWDYEFTIDKGTADGVVAGAVVMHGGSVVGRISNVERHQATVETILSPNCTFSVTIGDTVDMGVLRGAKGTSRTSPYRCQVDYLPLDVRAVAGMEVRTSTFGSTMPSGLPIGEVVEYEGKVKEEIEHARAMLRVRPRASLQDVRFVTVLLKK